MHITPKILMAKIKMLQVQPPLLPFHFYVKIHIAHLVGSFELTMVTIASWKVLLSPKSLTSILDMLLKLRLKTASLWQKPFEF